jgi:hypothetical protein
MSNIIKFSITGDTNAEQVTNRAKTAVSGFDKQLEGIGKKFGNSFRDIFLSFAAPMVLLNQAMSMISANIEKAKQDAQDGIDLMAKGDTVYATSEEKKTAAFFKAKAAREKEMAQVSAGKEQLGRDFSQTPEGAKAMRDFLNTGMNRTLVQTGMGGVVSYEGVFKSPAFQDFMIKRFIQTPEGAAYKPIFDSAGKDNFKPEGLSSNVIGVGQSPGMAIINAQLIVQQEIAEMMRKIAERYDAKESIDRAESTPYKSKPDYSVPAYPKFK